MVAKLSKWAGQYGTKYRVGELVHAGKLFRIEDGIYADTADVPEVEVVLAKYPSSVLTLESAYYYYNMSDEIRTSITLPRIANRRGLSMTVSFRAMSPAVR